MVVRSKQRDWRLAAIADNEAKPGVLNYCRHFPEVSDRELNIPLTQLVDRHHSNAKDEKPWPLQFSESAFGDAGTFHSGFGAKLGGLGRHRCVSHANAHVAQLDKEQKGLTYPDDDEAKSKKTGSVFRDPRRPSEFGIWALGLTTLFGGLLFFGLLFWASGLFIRLENPNDRAKGNGKQKP
jgi:hypothetical protein